MKALFAAVCLGLFLTSPALTEPFRIIVSDAETPLVPNSIMELAQQEGYFARSGVEVAFVRVEQSPMVMAALRSGEGEMANVSLDILLSAVAAGVEDLRAVMSPNKSLPYLIASYRISDFSDLEGKRFGIGRVGSVDHLLSMRVLAHYGVDLERLDLVALGQPQARAQALLAGQIDATTMSIGSFTAIAENPGISMLLSSADFYKAAPILSKVNIVRSETLAKRGPEVVAVIAAIILAARDFQAQPDLWVKAMQKARPDVALEDLEALASAFVPDWVVDGGMTREELRLAQSWLHEGEDFAGIAPADLGDFADFAPLAAALESLGPVSAAQEAAK